MADAEATLGPNHASMVPLLNGLGVVYKYTGRFDDAERVYRRALTLAEMLRPANTQQLADLYHNLGGLAHARGRFAEAEPLARSAVELRLRALGEQHPSVAADRAALAGILGPIGHALEAETSYKQFLHGEAVAWGMVAAAMIAAALQKTDSDTARRIISTVIALAPLPRVDLRGKRVFRRLKSDKKTSNGIVHFVLPRSIGSAEIVPDIPDSAVIQAIEELRYLSQA